MEAFLPIALQFIILIFAITIHEASHGWVAYKLGDPTAKYMGRLTFNPLAHIDPFGTIVLPVLLTLVNSPFVIGWAKPVPVNFMSLKRPKRDMFWVGLSGPASNILQAFIYIMVLKAMPFLASTLLGEVIAFGVLINIVLAVFNLIPIPPLDGSRLITSILPWRYAMVYNKLEPYGFFIILLLLMSGVLRLVISAVVPIILKLLNLSIPF